MTEGLILPDHVKPKQPASFGVMQQDDGTVLINWPDDTPACLISRELVMYLVGTHNEHVMLLQQLMQAQQAATETSFDDIVAECYDCQAAKSHGDPTALCPNHGTWHDDSGKAGAEHE